MDLLTADILSNIVETKRLRADRRLTEVVLPTSITQVVNATCPTETKKSLCQEVSAKITLLNAEETSEVFKDTTELAIEIGRLQYYLNQVNPNSPADVVDALWNYPTNLSSVLTAANNSSSDKLSISPSLIPSSVPSYFPMSDITTLPTGNPSELSTSSPLFDFLEDNSFDGGEALNNTSSPQYMAYSWLLDNENLSEYTEEQMLQRYSMATLYFATNGDQWLVNNLWLSQVSECGWFGKTGSQRRCNKKGKLVNLELDLNDLNGSIPAELGLLSSALETITLHGGPNSEITGTIPTELGYLTGLKVFAVRSNGLSGSIPSEIGNLRTLEVVDLSRNTFQGEVPTEIGDLSSLTYFDVSVNYLSGSLPTELGQLRKCQMMIFEDNAFTSVIPTEIGDLGELKALKGGLNEFDALPTELGGLRSIDFLSFQESNIAGPIPTELGNLRKLRKSDKILSATTRNDCSHSYEIAGHSKLFLFELFNFFFRSPGTRIQFFEW